MKKLLLSLLVAVFLVSACFAGYVNGYYRSNGTYVQGYYRSEPNYTVKDNYSYYGNSSPYTTKIGTNKYYNNSTSDYYRGYSKSSSIWD